MTGADVVLAHGLQEDLEVLAEIDKGKSWTTFPNAHSTEMPGDEFTWLNAFRAAMGLAPLIPRLMRLARGYAASP